MAPGDKKTCFVVMGFRTKTAYYTNKPARALNLDATYSGLIKPAVEAAGLECIRADEIQHSGVIDVPMYVQLQNADVVIADLSTANANAMYELGVRHALKPFTTIVIAEDQLEYPFDVNHTAIRRYKHLGEDIGVGEAKRFTDELRKAIVAIVGTDQVDSPVYTYLKIRPPRLESENDAPHAAELQNRGIGVEKLGAGDEPTVAELQEQLRHAKKAGKFVAAEQAASRLRKLVPGDVYYVQQLALATYKSKHPDPLTALVEAKRILSDLKPESSTDPETIGLWGAIHKRLWEVAAEHAYLDASVQSYKRGYTIQCDYYNGVNYAFMLDVRAHVSSGDDAIADRVEAQRTRRDVAKQCENLVKAAEAASKPQNYWVLATLWECHFALGNEAEARSWEARAVDLPGNEDWMVPGTREQLAKLAKILSV